MDDNFISDKNDRLEEIPGKFVDSVSGLEAKIMKEVEVLVSQLEMKDGVLLMTDKNLSLIESINQKINNVIFDEEYQKNLTSFISEFGKQAKLNNTYFQTIGEDFQLKPLYKTVLENTQKNAINLLSEDAFTQALNVPIKQILESSITNKQSFTDTIESLRYIIQGDDEIDGRLLSHVKRVAYDSFAVSDRSYTNAVSTDLALEFYRFTGGKIEDTRCFCRERAGKYFHQKEIEGWGDGKGLGKCEQDGLWQGANANTDKSTIFLYLGGYNCKHSILPVSTKSVPKDVINRAISEGYYKEVA
jgi:hypothetical protein